MKRSWHENSLHDIFARVMSLLLIYIKVSENNTIFRPFQFSLPHLMNLFICNVLYRLYHNSLLLKLAREYIYSVLIFTLRAACLAPEGES